MTLVLGAALATGASVWFAIRPVRPHRLEVVRSATVAAAAAAAAAVAGAGAAGPGRAGQRAVAGGACRRIGREEVRLIVAVTAALAFLVGPVPAVVVAAALGAGWHVKRRHSAAATHARAVAALPDICDNLARQLLSGELPGGALRAAAQVGPAALAGVLREAAAMGDLGGSPADALARPGPYAQLLAPLAASWAATVAAGAPLGPALRGIGSALAAERGHRRAVDTELAGPRLTGWLLAGLPIFGLAVGASIGTRSLSILIGTPLGTACLVAAACLDGLGVLWMRALGRRLPP